MKAIGFRAGMELGYDFETYAMYKKISSERLSEHFSHGIQFHNRMGLSFLKMAVAFFRERQKQVRDLGLPLLGVDYGMETSVFLPQENLFTPQVAYTYGMLLRNSSGIMLIIFQ